MIFAKTDKNLISMMHARDFSALMQRAGKIISTLEAHAQAVSKRKKR